MGDVEKFNEENLKTEKTWNGKKILLWFIIDAKVNVIAVS